MHAVMIKFYREAPPPARRGEGVKIAAFGIGQLVGATKLPNGEVVTPKEIQANVELDPEMARLEVRLSGKRLYPYDVWYVLDYEGEKMQRRVFRAVNFLGAKDWVQVSAIQFIAKHTADAGGNSLMTGYRVTGDGKAAKAYDLLPDDARKVSGGTEEDR